MFVLSFGGSGGRFLRHYHDTKSIKSYLITDILAIVWAIPAMCVGHKALITSRGCFASRWLVGDLRSFTSSTLHLITRVFVPSVCVNNLWISYFCLGGLWLFNSAWCVHACSCGRIYQSPVFHSRWRLSSCKKIVCYASGNRSRMSHYHEKVLSCRCADYWCCTEEIQDSCLCFL